MNPFPRDQDKQREVMYLEQVRTNELLEQLIKLLSKPEPSKTTVTKPVNTSTSRKPAVKQKPRGKAG